METDGTFSTVRESHLGFGDYFFFIFDSIFTLFSLLSCFNTCIKQKSTLSESFVNSSW